LTPFRHLCEHFQAWTVSLWVKLGYVAQDRRATNHKFRIPNFNRAFMAGVSFGVMMVGRSQIFITSSYHRFSFGLVQF
jgi:hypothetical protein